MKEYAIVDMANGQTLEMVSSGNGKTALKKFRKGLLSTGMYEYHKTKSGVWELSASYGRYFQARETTGKTQVRKKATLVSVWDGGETSIESRCIVDLMSRRIVHVSSRRIVYGPYDTREVDDCVESLDRQYVMFGDGTEFPVFEYGDDGDWGSEGKVPFYLD